MIDSGALGHVYSVLHVLRSFQDTPGSWYVQLPHFNIVDHGIHYLDLSRHVTGQTPLCVKATTTRVPSIKIAYAAVQSSESGTAAALADVC